MDKYTYNLKTDKIQTLVRRGDYETAVKIADTMDWGQEKNIRLLNAAAEAYEKTGRTDDATELLLRAYERSSAGKRILYKLTELALSAGNLKDAETFFKKYLDEAKEENDRYILRFHIAEARGESTERKIRILEAYHRLEPNEEVYTCKLAELYKEAGRGSECVALCDQIILWFGVGPCVDRAMELKECFEPLTEEQEKHRANKEYYEAQVQRIADEMEKSNAAESDKVLDPQDTSEAIANYSASVDSDLIQELMEEEIRESAEQAAAEEALAKSRVPSAEEAGEAAPAEAEKPEEAVPAEAEKPEEAVPAEAEEPEKAVPAVAEEPEETAPAEAEEPEETAPAEAEEPEETAPAEAEEPEETAPAEAEEPEVIVESSNDIVIPDEFRIAAKLPEEEPVSESAEVPENEVPVIPAEDAESAESAASVISGEESEEETAEEEVPVEELPEEITSSFEHEHCFFLADTGSEEDTGRAVDILDDYYNEIHQEMAQVARISAAKLNRKGLIGSLPKLIHKDLIIDQANEMSDELIGELFRIIYHMDTDKLFVLMDGEEALTELRLRMFKLVPADEKLPKIRMTESEAEPDPEPVAEEPEIIAEEEEIQETEPEEEEEAVQEEELVADSMDEADKAADQEDEEEESAERRPERVISFENIDEDVILDERDFIRYAEYFAHELECSLDDSAYDALEGAMADILGEGSVLTAGDVEDLIEDAADMAEKKKFGKKYDKDGFLILRKKNFR